MEEKLKRKFEITATSINKSYLTNNYAFHESYCSIINNNLC